jgi:hypothetical protein
LIEHLSCEGGLLHRLDVDKNIIDEGICVDPPTMTEARPNTGFKR